MEPLPDGSTILSFTTTHGPLAWHDSPTRETRDQYHSILENIHEGILVFDENLMIRYANRAVETLTGLPRAILHGTPLERHLPELRHCPPVDGFRFFESGEVFLPHAAGGADHLLDLTLFPIKVGGSSILGLALVMRDVTAERRLDKARADFAAAVSQELRTPLAAIRGYAANLLDRECLEEEKRRGVLAIIDAEAARLLHLIDDLLVLHHQESGSPAAPFAGFPPATLCAAAVEAVRHRLEAHRSHLQVDCPADLPQLIGDRDSLCQALSHLLDNAIKFCPDGALISLAVSTLADGGGFRISVTDNGPGIPARDLPHVFEKFYRVRSQATGVPGTGLGLAIVRGIIARHGGTISVESEPGKGSLFRILLPQEKPE
jgi:signal transduction histidine kinase